MARNPRDKAKDRARYYRLRKYAEENGLCLHCAKAAPEKNRRWCTSCLIETAVKRRYAYRRRVMNEQGREVRKPRLRA